MVLATLLFVLAMPQAAHTAKAAAPASAANSERTASAPANSDNASANTTNSGKEASTAELPSAPEPKAKFEVEPASLRPAAQPLQPLRPAVTHPRETPRQRKMWYGLMAAGHSAAAFDAWSTRRAISGGYGQESNPLLRPFAGSNAMYAATQVSPAVMDFIGKRMMTSQSGWVRKMWWVPQTLGASFSFAAGAHNMTVVH
jgi:hypothetical protein